jgi:2-phospho-L-lactate/phosphoenolpyruvate guanylyltransferase
MDALMAIIPVKPLAEAKSRLASVLSPDERVALAQRLLERTLLKVTRARGLLGVVVISRDPQVLQTARKYGAWSLVETHSTLNQALDQARRVCIANGARAVLVVPADLPRLRVRDVEQVIALGEPAPCVVIAPARRDEGTNLLLLNPATVLAFQFGVHSFVQHRLSAAQAAIPIQIYDVDRVAFDLDLPEDLDISARS